MQPLTTRERSALAQTPPTCREECRELESRILKTKVAGSLRLFVLFLCYCGPACGNNPSLEALTSVVSLLAVLGVRELVMRVDWWWC